MKFRHLPFIFILAIMILHTGFLSAQNPFITTWKTNNPGSSGSTSITIPTHPSYSYSYDVDWNNDGTYDEFGITGNKTHDFGFSGTYTIAIKGNFPAIYFNNSGDKKKILSVDHWGDIQWETFENAFYGASNLTSGATDAPDLSNVNFLFGMFRDASSFNGNLSGWDVSGVTNMYNMFYGATVFNQNIGAWNVSSVTDMDAMFKDAKSFNQKIGTWNVSHVTAMWSMFSGATSFNRNIGAWDVSAVKDMSYMFSGATSFNQNIGGWDVSSVKDMDAMFKDATNFNGNIGAWNMSGVTAVWSMFSGATSFNRDIGGWNVSAVPDMQLMFSGATSFNQNLGAWNISSVTDMTDMLDYSGLSTANYDATLIGWEGHAVTPSNVTLGAQGLTWCAGEAARTRLISSYSYAWTINGDSKVCSTMPLIQCAENHIVSCDDRVTFDFPVAHDNNGSLPVVQTDGTGFTSGSVFPAGVTTLTFRATNPAGTATCTIKVEVLPPVSIKHISGIQDGDTLHIAACLPPDISKKDLDLGPYHHRISLRSNIYDAELPTRDERPAGLWKMLLYSYEVADQCGRSETFNYYVALYDLDPPVFRSFPRDTTIATPGDLPPVPNDVRIIDICRYVVWDTVTTAPLLHYDSGDTLAFVRRWIAEDEVGNKSFRDQMIYLRSVPRPDLNTITARIVKETDLLHGRFSQTTGTVGVPVTLYHIDTLGSSVAVDTMTSGKWQGQYGSILFTPVLSGSYRIKFDLPVGYAAVHPDGLIHSDGWSDLLTVAGDSTLDIGTILLIRDTSSIDPDTSSMKVPIVSEYSDPDQPVTTRSIGFKVYPNPSYGKIRISLPGVGRYDYTVFNRLGQSMQTGIVESGSEIDLTGRQDGLYYIRVEKDRVFSDTRAILLFSRR